MDTVSLLSLLKQHYTLHVLTVIGHRLFILKLFVESAAVVFCTSKVLCIVPFHIHVYRHAVCFLLLQCVFRPFCANTNGGFCQEIFYSES
jgi:hypothetical protein